VIVALPLAIAMVAAFSSVGGAAGVHASGRLTPRVQRVGAAASGITFSHGVPVDEQRPGFEPDLVIDPHHQGTDDGDRIYSSMPFGFSTTASFISMSRDSGETYKLTAGSVTTGKPTTCFGGGDTDLQLDKNGAIFFSDLQGLTNLSNSVSTDHAHTWTTNCLGAPNTPVDRMWYAHTGTLSGGNLNLYEEYDAVDSSLPSAQNQLVETISHDGVTFAPLVNTNVSSDCLGFGSANCVNDNEGLPGNQIVDPASGDIFIAHTAPGGASSGAPQVLIERGHVTLGPPDTVTWTHIGPINSALCPDPTCIDSSGNPEDVGAENFPVITEDHAHNFYVAFSTAPVNASGAQTAAEQIYVARSADGIHWGTPVQVSTGGTNTLPWIAAGDSGRVDVAWYHTNTTNLHGVYGAGSLTNAEWTVQMGQSLNAASTSAHYSVVTVTEHFIKHGEICTNGLGCTTGGDRSMGDFMQIAIDARGAAAIAYVDDTSNVFVGGEAAGPTEIVRQKTGPSLKASVGTIVPGGGPGNQFGQVSDDPGDATYSANGSDTAAGANLDLLKARISQTKAGAALTVSMTLKSLASLATSPSAGGVDGSWIMRWVQVAPGTPGNGHVYYAGMESNAGQAPRFFDGDMGCVSTTHCKFFTFDSTTSITGTYSASTGVITLKVPLADIGGPASGTTLYSAVAFTTTESTPQTLDPIFNEIDATTPLGYVIK
jgi:hypothetical protein